MGRSFCSLNRHTAELVCYLACSVSLNRGGPAEVCEVQGKRPKARGWVRLSGSLCRGQAGRIELLGGASPGRGLLIEHITNAS